MKKTLLSLLITISLIFLTYTPVIADPAWHYCDVEMAGTVEDGRVFIRLTHAAPSPLFTNKFFLADADLGKEMLAIALLAITNNQQILAFTDPELNYYPTLNTVYLVK